MRRVLAWGLLGLAALVAVLVLAALRLPSRQLSLPPAPARAVDAEAVAHRLGAAIRIPTISFSTDPVDLQAEAFSALHAWLAATYPRMHHALARETVGGHSLLYTWAGTDPTLEPMLLLAHQDVVPAENPGRWSRPPFAGRVDDGFVWGRGALDDKGSLVAICEAVEALLAEGFVPRRTVLLAFGHDEEVGGQGGAVEIAQLLAARGVRAFLALDEGAVGRGLLPGFEPPVAFVAIAEKGSATLEFVARAAGGHSSVPPRETAAGILARAVVRVESHPMPGGVEGVTRTFARWLAPDFPLYARVPLANLWLFGWPLDQVLSRQPAVNALLRTTTAVTMLSGSPKENVLPSEAIAVVNFRLLPGDSAETVRARVEALVDDPRIAVRFKHPPREASPVAPINGPPFALLQRTIEEILPEAIVAPVLGVGGTDCRHYQLVTDALYRFAPFVYGPADLERFHGIDERAAVAGLADAVRFYARFVESASRE